MKTAPAILLVDDEPMLLRLLSMVLRKEGFTVFEAQNGLEAVQLFASYQAAIELVVTDLDMPVMDGPEEISRLREIRPDVRVLVISGAAPDLIRRAGVPDMLRKPFTPTQLLHRVREVLRPA